MWFEVEVQRHSFACGFPVVPAPFVEETVRPHRMDFAPVSKSTGQGCTRLFPDSHFSPIDPHVCSYAGSRCLDFYSWIVSFKIEKCKFCDFVFVFQHGFGFWGAP